MHTRMHKRMHTHIYTHAHTHTQKKSHPRDILKLLESENGKINRIVTHSTQYLSYAKIFGIEEFAVQRKASTLLSRINSDADTAAIMAPGRPFLERRLIESAMEGLQLSYDHLVGWLIGSLAGWLVHWLVHWLVGRLVGKKRAAGSKRRVVSSGRQVWWQQCQ